MVMIIWDDYMIYAEAEAAILWSLDVKCWLTRKDPDAGEDWRQEEKGTIGWLDDITDSVDMNLSKLREIVKDRVAWHAAVPGHKELDTT